MTLHRRAGRSIGRRAPGQALVEFALVAPIFFILLFATIEAGRFILFYEALHNATREGARYAIVHGSNSSCPSGPMPAGQLPPVCYDAPGANVIARVKAAAFNLLGPSVTVTPTWPLDNGRESEVIVVASYAYQPIIPLPLPPIAVSAESRLVINN
jgi:hypothetical protein